MNQNLLGVVYSVRTECRPNPSGKKPVTPAGCKAILIVCIILIPILVGCACVGGLIYWIYTCTCKKKSVVEQPVTVIQM